MISLITSTVTLSYAIRNIKRELYDYFSRHDALGSDCCAGSTNVHYTSHGDGLFPHRCAFCSQLLHPVPKQPFLVLTPVLGNDIFVKLK